MRVEIPEYQQDRGLLILGEHYAPEIVAAGMNFPKVTYAKSKLSLREFEAARLRTAQINGCNICQNFRAERDVPGLLAGSGGAGSVVDNGPAPDEAFYAAVADWRNSPLFSERERLAIEYAEGMGSHPHGLADDEDFWRRAKAAFSDDEIVDISFCIASWIGAGRVAHVLGLDSVCGLAALQGAKAA